MLDALYIFDTPCIQHRLCIPSSIKPYEYRFENAIHQPYMVRVRCNNPEKPLQLPVIPSAYTAQQYM